MTPATSVRQPQTARTALVATSASSTLMALTRWLPPAVTALPSMPAAASVVLDQQVAEEVHEQAGGGLGGHQAAPGPRLALGAAFFLVRDAALGRAAS